MSPKLTKVNIYHPLYSDDPNGKEDIASLPEQSRSVIYGVQVVSCF